VTKTNAVPRTGAADRRRGAARRRAGQPAGQPAAAPPTAAPPTAVPPGTAPPATVPPATAPPATPPTSGRHWLALPVVLAGTFMTFLDFFIVNVAIPSTQRDLSASSAQIQWIVAGYGLAYASCLIIGSRLGDVSGRRRVFMIGLALFTAASLACGVAASPAMLITARAAQGFAAALLFPQVLSILGLMYSGADRVRAFVAYGMTLGLAAVGGQLIGGALIQADPDGLGWRTCFLINVPVGLLALVLTPRLVPESRAEDRSRLDLLGAALVTLGLVAVVLPLVDGREQGWPAWTWLCLAASAPLLLVFVASQRRRAARGRTPLIDLRLFRERAFAVGVASVLVFYAGLASYFLVLALYLQQGHGLNALDSGLTVTPMGIGFFATTIVARRLSGALGRHLPSLGALVLAAGLVATSLAAGHIGTTGSVWWVIPWLFVDGLGMGMVTAPLISTVLAGITPRHAGEASGVLSTMQQVGNAVGVAVIGVIFYGVLGRAAGHPDAFPHAFRSSLVYVIVLDVALAALIQLLPRRPARR
jgi:EmrB/QacA subfamily drug resistance transporter